MQLDKIANEREKRDRQIDRWTDRNTDGHTERQR